MIQYFINHFQLRYRIYASYMAAGIVIFAIIMMTYVVFNKVAGHFQDFITFSNQSQIDLLLTAQVADIHRQTLIYTYEGHQSAADQVTSIYGNLIQQIDQNLQHSQPEIKRILTTIKQHLVNYHATFLQVKQQRDLQQKLINVEFRDNATAVERLINQLILQSDPSVATQLELKPILSSLLLVEKNVFRYLDSLDASYIITAKNSLSSVFGSLSAINVQENPVRSIVDQAIYKLHLYEQSFTQGVQRTRGYLYLINVVMAAEAYEIHYQSKKFSTLITEQMRKKEQAIHAGMREALYLLLLFGACLLMILITFTYGIGKSIAMPITQLTETFRELTQGSSNAHIPEYPVSDEISELAHAAGAFRDKNTQTERLLEESMQLTQQLEKNKAELERSNDELEQFVYTVSHDLKSPLVTSMGFIGIIRKLADQGQYEQAIEKLDKVTLSIERMGQLITDLLELSRIGRIDLDKKMIDLNNLLEQLTSSHSEQMRRVGFHWVIKPDLPSIYGNESRIRQLFENILSNAIKYTHNPEQGSKLEIGAISHEDHWLIYCQDNGPGIESAFHQKIFGLFYRLDTKQEGSGVGLAIAKKVMKFHGGDIWVESSSGAGATFWLKFPVPSEEMERVEHDTSSTGFITDRR
ncbi:MAG: hypothetical protein IPO71_14125 [Nitrosomonas sp.]|nr:hypothetical protein [Nitrosomonas sp.]